MQLCATMREREGGREKDRDTVEIEIESGDKERG